MNGKIWGMAGIVAAALAVRGAETPSDYASRMISATFKVFQKDSTATGFLVAGPAAEGNRIVLVTARHVLEKATGDQVLLVLRKPKGDGTFERFDHSVRIRDGKKDLWTTHPTEDIAAMVIKLPDGPEGREAVPLPMDALATEKDLLAAGLHAGSPGLMLGFPTRFESNAAGFPVARQAGIASHPLTPVRANKVFLADFCTFAGDSGGPMFVEAPRRKGAAGSLPLVIGMVISSYRHDEKIVTMYEERMIHHPLDISTVVHAEFLREAVEAALKAAR